MPFTSINQKWCRSSCTHNGSHHILPRVPLTLVLCLGHSCSPVNVPKVFVAERLVALQVHLPVTHRSDARILVPEMTADAPDELST